MLPEKTFHEGCQWTQMGQLFLNQEGLSSDCCFKHFFGYFGRYPGIRFVSFCFKEWEIHTGVNFRRAADFVRLSLSCRWFPRYLDFKTWVIESPSSLTLIAIILRMFQFGTMQYDFAVLNSRSNRFAYFKSRFPRFLEMDIAGLGANGCPFSILTESRLQHSFAEAYQTFSSGSGDSNFRPLLTEFKFISILITISYELTTIWKLNKTDRSL